MLAAKQFFSIVALSAFLTVESAAPFRTGCSRNGTVQSGDTCDIFCANNNVSSFQLAHVNNDIIDANCDNLIPGEQLCIALTGEDCNITTVVQQSVGSCDSTAVAAGISVSTLLLNNPDVDPDCSNAYPGRVLCTSKVVIHYDYGARGRSWIS